MSKKSKLLRKFINGDISEDEKKDFIKIAASDEEFRRAMIREIELDELIDSLSSSSQ